MKKSVCFLSVCHCLSIAYITILIYNLQTFHVYFFLVFRHIIGKQCSGDIGIDDSRRRTAAVNSKSSHNNKHNSSNACRPQPPTQLATIDHRSSSRSGSRWPSVVVASRCFLRTIVGSAIVAAMLPLWCHRCSTIGRTVVLVQLLTTIGVLASGGKDHITHLKYPVLI